MMGRRGNWAAGFTNSATSTVCRSWATPWRRRVGRARSSWSTAARNGRWDQEESTRSSTSAAAGWSTGCSGWNEADGRENTMAHEPMKLIAEFDNEAEVETAVALLREAGIEVLTSRDEA